MFQCPECGSTNIHRVCSSVRLCRDCNFRGRKSQFELSEEEIDLFREEAIQRKKKGIRYGGKYKGRGKEVRRMP